MADGGSALGVGRNQPEGSRDAHLLPLTLIENNDSHQNRSGLAPGLNVICNKYGRFCPAAGSSWKAPAKMGIEEPVPDRSGKLTCPATVQFKPMAT